MINKKYTKDYQIDLKTGPNGKLIEEAVYIGPLYRLEGGSLKRRKLFFRMIVCTAIAVFLFLSGLWNNSVYAHQIYINMPALGLGIVSAFYGVGCFHLKGEADTFRREEKDKSLDRMKASSLVGMILAGVALGGSVVLMITGQGGFGIWDIYFLITLIGQLVAAIEVRRLADSAVLSEISEEGSK